MNVPDDRLRREIALFRYRIIADLLLLPSGSAGIGAMMQAKAEQEHTIPGTQRTRVAAETIRDWLHHYRQGGFDALYPKPRADRGQSRRLSPDVAELLVTIKAEHSIWSVRSPPSPTAASAAAPGADLPALHRVPDVASSACCRRTGTSGTTRRCVASTPAFPHSRPPVGSTASSGSAPPVGTVGSRSGARPPVRSSLVARPGSAPEPTC